jgi:hypothetical protein
VSSLPASLQQRPVRHPRETYCPQVGDRKVSATVVQVTCSCQPTPRRQHLHVDEVGSRESLTPRSSAGESAIAVVVSERGDEDARINDDHPGVTLGPRCLRLPP